METICSKCGKEINNCICEVERENYFQALKENWENVTGFYEKEDEE